MNLLEGLGFSRRDLSRFFARSVPDQLQRAVKHTKRKACSILGGPSAYSPAFLAAIKAAPQALVAMDAETCDARTQANIYLQLLLDQVLGGPYVDGTLRGPTSSAWLTCWRSYLEKLNVTFLNAKLLSLRNTCQQVSGNNAEGIEIILELPQIQPNYPIPPGTPAGVSGEDFIINKIRKAGFCVVALDPVAAEQVTAGWENAGVPADLRQFTSYVQVTFPALVDRYTITIPFSEPLNRQDAEERLRRILSRIQSVLKDDLESPRVRSAFRAMTKVTGELMPASDNQIEEYQISLWFQRRIGPEEILFIEEVVACWIAEEGGDQEPRLTSSQPEWYDEPATILTPRLPEQMYGLSPTDRFQTFTGIQYYFKQDFKMIRGHVYFPDSDWGLSAISQGQFWWWFSPNGAKRHDEVRGVLSVDIGACRTQSSYNGKTFFDSSPGEIADEVWRQVKESLRTMRGPNALFTSLPLPEPIYYHLDENLIYNGDKLSANLTPFPINNVGDWVWRPRCMPWVPGQSRFVDPPRTDGTDVWQASHGGYRVHNGQVVFCGHYMRTFTRMATMEAANESARHAVNAILDYLAENADEPKKGTHEKIASGDYCQIWDIEQHELDDLDFFKRVDEMLFKAGKPHMADILQFDKIADLQYPDPSPAQALAAALGVTLGKDWGVQPMELAGGLKGLSDVARQLGKDLGASYGYGGDASPFMGLLSVLTNGRIGGAGGNKQG
ncbi:MAG: hypothetical protein U0359_20335 [Byssovorax sp.]